MYVIGGPLWAADSSISIEILAHFRISCSAAARRTVSQEFLSSRSPIYFAGINTSVGIDRDHVRPMEFAGLASSLSKASQRVLNFRAGELFPKFGAHEY